MTHRRCFLCRSTDVPVLYYCCASHFLSPSCLPLPSLYVQKARGEALLSAAFDHLGLLEREYFGLEFYDRSENLVWLDPVKAIGQQVKKPRSTVFKLCVKFYPPDPTQLQDELTRYHFVLQIRRDLAGGKLTCSRGSSAMLSSLLLQSDVGECETDIALEQLHQQSYVPEQAALEPRILELHQGHSELTPAEVDFRVLELARCIETFGVQLHSAIDSEGAPIHLGVAHYGISVYQNSTKINAFSWSHIRKLSFKRKRFLIKFHPDGRGMHQDLLEFSFRSRDSSKAFWRNCVEYHSFFRLHEEPSPRPKHFLLSRGSMFRYSGRTQKQLCEFMQNASIKKVPFQRKSSQLRMSHLQNTTPKRPISPLKEKEEQEKKEMVKEELEKLDSDQITVLPKQAYPYPGFETQECQEVDGRVEEKDIAVDECERQSVIVSTPVESWCCPPDPSSPTLSPTLGGESKRDDSMDSRRKLLNDRAYFLMKELCMTERTHVKDLAIIAVAFQNFLHCEGLDAETLPHDLISGVIPLLEFHTEFLKELEQRLALWEGRSNLVATEENQRIGDVLLKNLTLLQERTVEMSQLGHTLLEWHQETATPGRLSIACRDFEMEKVCYLPLYVLLLKPLQRPLHYQQLLTRLCNHYPADHPDAEDSQASLEMATEICSPLTAGLQHLEAVLALATLQAELPGLPGLVAPHRVCQKLIRVGCLNKVGKKGLQQRMFFLFSDMIVFANKDQTPSGHFKAHGRLMLREITLKEGSEGIPLPNSFIMSTMSKNIIVSASSRAEMDKWMEDITSAIGMARTTTVLVPPTLENGFDASIENLHLESRDGNFQGSSEGILAGQRSNTPVQVCWHRHTSISMADLHRATQNQLSGYLLRKFKNSSGWQKLWVSFCNFCLFFYKSHQDDVPLASLPLLGYAIGLPNTNDGISKDLVFKLQFKSHVYFFRTDSAHAFDRWMEVIRSATSSSSRTRLLSRIDSQPGREPVLPEL
uniref:FERM, ARHGEF and pleckstrin domain-containing protein 1-like isoform X2 n=1 Tax=Myxine glutinosa TaxID=7769 RepID=UPI003590106C